MNYYLLNDFVERVFVAENNQPMKTSTIRKKVEKLGFRGVKTRNVRFLLCDSIFQTKYTRTDVTGKRPLFQFEPLLFAQISAKLGHLSKDAFVQSIDSNKERG